MRERKGWPRRGLYGTALFLLAVAGSRPGMAQDAATQGAESSSHSSIVHGNPSNYLAILRKLGPGQTLLLSPGAYGESQEGSGLPIFHLHGTNQARIVISGPETGERPVFHATQGRNTVRVADASYVTIRNLDLNGRDFDVDAVKAEGVSDHITLENLCIRNHGNDQQIVGISTKAPAWDWVIRGNIILRAGTGIYLGSSDGSAPFVHGVIEYNLIADTLGYNMEIKHQLPRPNLPGLPAAAGATIIRHNVFSKAARGMTGDMARPNLFVGHFPPAGPGEEDVYEIYGNFFYQNPTGEPLFQGEGNLAIYSNLLWNENGDAILIRPHHAFPRRVNVFANTIVAAGTGIKIVGAWEKSRQLVLGNIVFASMPILANDKADNLSGPVARAQAYLRHPQGPLGKLDLSPVPGRLPEGKLPEGLLGYRDARLDFEGHDRKVASIGAYAGVAAIPEWLPALQRKPVPKAFSFRSSNCVGYQ
jgi:hypothetical protein